VRTSSLYGCNVIAAVVGATLVSMVAEIASEIDMGVLTASTTTNGKKGRSICIISKEAGLSPVYTLQLAQKSYFQPSTTKSDNIGHLTFKTGQIWPLGGFEGGFPFCEN